MKVHKNPCLIIVDDKFFAKAVLLENFTLGANKLGKFTSKFIMTENHLALTKSMKGKIIKSFSSDNSTDSKDLISFVTKNKKIISIPVKVIPTLSVTSPGVKLIKLEKGDKVVSITISTHL